jgi:nitrogen fixation protein FixH
VKAGREITGRMVLMGAIGFFGIIFAANGALVFFALESWPGLATDHAYEEGVEYNRTLAAAREQAGLGWVSALTYEGGVHEGGVARTRLTRPGGVPVTGLAARITFRRPVGEAIEIVVPLAEAAPGLYLAEAVLPLAGRWHAMIEATRDGAPIYRMRHDVMVAP